MLNKFFFSDDTSAQRERRQVEVLMFPTSLPPMFDMKVMAVQQTGVITVPFTANITAGSKTWLEIYFNSFCYILYPGPGLELTEALTAPT